MKNKTFIFSGTFTHEIKAPTQEEASEKMEELLNIFDNGETKSVEEVETIPAD